MSITILINTHRWNSLPHVEIIKTQLTSHKSLALELLYVTYSCFIPPVIKINLTLATNFLSLNLIPIKCWAGLFSFLLLLNQYFFACVIILWNTHKDTNQKAQIILILYLCFSELFSERLSNDFLCYENKPELLLEIHVTIFTGFGKV